MIRLSVCLAAIVYATSANADWQYTKWGMTLDQVLAASKGKLKPCNATACAGQKTEKSTAQAFGEYAAGEFTFKAFAMFDQKSQKLVSIGLNLKNPSQAASLIGSLRSKYGEPATQSRTSILSLYVWRNQKDQISIMTIGSDSAVLKYQPRITDSNKGL